MSLKKFRLSLGWLVLTCLFAAWSCARAGRPGHAAEAPAQPHPAAINEIASGIQSRAAETATPPTQNAFDSLPSTNTVKAPYLIYKGRNTEMALLWQLNATRSCTLHWGCTPACAYA